MGNINEDASVAGLNAQQEGLLAEAVVVEAVVAEAVVAEAVVAEAVLAEAVVAEAVVAEAVVAEAVVAAAATKSNKGKGVMSSKKSKQVTQHMHMLHSVYSFDLESVALEVHNTIVSHAKSWDTMGKKKQRDVCKFVLDNIAALPASHAAPLPKLGEIVAAAEELWQNVVLLFTVWDALFQLNLMV